MTVARSASPPSGVHVIIFDMRGRRDAPPHHMPSSIRSNLEGTLS